MKEYNIYIYRHKNGTIKFCYWVRSSCSYFSDTLEKMKVCALIIYLLDDEYLLECCCYIASTTDSFLTKDSYVKKYVNIYLY
jgi:hypothetical protein